MNKNLRLFMTALLCAVLGVTWGQTPAVTLDFTTNDVWQFPEGSGNSTTETKTFTNDGYTITLADGYYYNTGYLMLTPGASLSLPAFDFAVSTIEVVGRTGASGKTKENIYVGDVAVSTEATGSTSTNTFAIAADYQAAGNIYTLKVSEKNAQITAIKVYKAGGQTVKPTPTMSFSPSSISVVVGEDFATPVLTYDGDGTVTYSSDNEEVATVDASTGEVDVVAAGVANITASAPETSNYKEASASYKITAANPQGTHEIVDGVFDFSDNTDYGSGLTPGLYTDPEHDYEYDPNTWTAGNITLVTEGKYRWWFNASSGNTLRFYSNLVEEEQTSKMTISAPAGKTITEIALSGSSLAFTADVGEFASGKWTGEAQSVVLTYSGSGTKQIKTITVTYTDGDTPPEKQTPTMKFTPNYVNFFLGGTFTAPELTYDGDGTVTYASDNEEVATVNATTGAVTIKNVVGRATIKATATETENYEAADASYTINVAEPQNTHEVVDGTFDFTDATDYGSGLTPSDDGNEYIYDPSTWTAGNVVLNVEGKYRWWLNASGNTLRLYSNLVEEEQTTKITLSVPAGKKINKIDFTGSGTNNFTADSGELSNGAWTGEAQTVVLTYNGSGTIQIKTITVDYGGNRIDPAFAWSAESATATLGQPFTAPTLSYAQGFNGEITYTSSNENVATISATGAVTIVGAGTTTIKATTPSTPDYLESSAFYTLTVKDPAASDVTYDFTGTEDYGSGVEPTNDGSVYIYDDSTWKNDPVSLVTSGKYRWWTGTNGNTLRLYSNIVNEEETTKLTFSVPSGKSITAIDFVVGVNDAFTANVGEFGGKSWAGDAQNVVLTLAGNIKPYISTIKVTYKDAGKLLGDANNDGAVNIADVTVTVDYVLTGDSSFIILENANVNGDFTEDGTPDVNITDVTLIVNMILSSH
ncbi:MAG: Ig-like domain-containing protein [Prevotella sp.]|nr:Ig-like domain-containing protein [Prevotella sp.]